MLLWIGRERLLCLSQVGLESIVPVVANEGINGGDIEACSDHHDFGKLVPISNAQEAFDVLERYFFSVAQKRVSAGDSLPSQP